VFGRCLSLVSLVLVMACGETSPTLDAAVRDGGSSTEDAGWLEQDGSSGSSASAVGTGVLSGAILQSASAFYQQSGGEMVILHSDAEICARINVDMMRPPHSWLLLLDLVIGQPASTAGVMVHVGSYPVGESAGGVTLSAFVEHGGNDCRDRLGLTFGVMPRGEVVLLEVSEDRIRGEYDIHWGESRLSGTFDAPRCLRPSDLPCGTAR